MIRARFPVALFALWLVASWTVPVCCLTASMASMAAMDHAGSAGMMEMSGHPHHHHPSAAAPDLSKLRLSSSASCAQTCDTPALAAVVSRTSLKVEDRLAASSIGHLPSAFFNAQSPINLQSAICHRQLSPPGNTPDASVSLRI